MKEGGSHANEHPMTKHRSNISHTVELLIQPTVVKSLWIVLHGDHSLITQPPCQSAKGTLA